MVIESQWLIRPLASTLFRVPTSRFRCNKKPTATFQKAVFSFNSLEVCIFISALVTINDFMVPGAPLDGLCGNMFARPVPCAALIAQTFCHLRLRPNSSAWRNFPRRPPWGLHRPFAERVGCSLPRAICFVSLWSGHRRGSFSFFS